MSRYAPGCQTLSNSECPAVDRPYRKSVTHYDEPGHAHFLTFSCYDRLPLLSKDRTRLWFLQALAEARAGHNFDLWAWVVMPEHVHLLIYPKLPDYHIEKILASVKAPVGARAIRYLKHRQSPFLVQPGHGPATWGTSPVRQRSVDCSASWIAANGASQLPGSGCRNSRAVGYHGLSSRSSSQRHSGT